MNSDNQQAISAIVDAAIAKSLSTAYRDLSRRAFLSSLTRKAMAFAGVAVAAQALPFVIRDARAQTQSTCGLTGRLCGSPCTGGVGQLWWTACCLGGSGGGGQCSYYTCCTYQDLCAASFPAGCGRMGGGALAWCTSGVYICTTVCCRGFFQDFASCNGSCSGAAC
jgi:hypothetical protein